jgi:RecA-family ATPase
MNNSTNNNINDSIDQLKQKLQEKWQNWDFNWKKAGSQWQGFCPHHGDSHKPNLYIKEKDGITLFKCFACGYGGTLKNFESYHQANLQSQLLTNFANICADALEQNNSLNAQISHKYLEFRNPHYKKFVEDYLLVGTIPNVTKFYLSDLMPKIDEKTDEKAKAELNELRDKLNNIIATAKNNTPLLFFYTNPQGLVEQIKVRYIYKIQKTIDTSNEKLVWTSELNDISFLDERNNKQFAIIKAKKQTINAFNLYPVADRKKFTVFITEGEFNAISMTCKEYEQREDVALNDVRIISIGSAQNLDQNINLFKYLLKTNDNIVFALDDDDAGKRALFDFVTKHKEFQNCFMLSLPNNNNKDKLVKDLDDYIAANDFVSASEIYKDIKIKKIKEQIFFLEKSLNIKEKERIKTVMNNAEKAGFEFVKTLYKENIDDDDEIVHLKKYSKTVSREWLIENLIPKSQITIFAGLGGSGKTTIMLQWILNALLGQDLNDEIKVQQIEKALIISAEENRDEIASKINNILFEYFAVFDDVKYDKLQDELDNRIKIITKHKILTQQDFGKPAKSENFYVIKNYIDSFNPDLVLIDSLTSTNLVELQKSHIAQAVMIAIEELVENRSCILLNHLTKDAINADNITEINIDKMLGSASLTNKVRQVLLIYKDSLKVAKSNLLSLQDITNTYYKLFEVINVTGKMIRWGRNIKKEQQIVIPVNDTNQNQTDYSQTNKKQEKKNKGRNSDLIEDFKNQTHTKNKKLKKEDINDDGYEF